MSNLGPQQFEIPISDQLFSTNNPQDPIEGISPTALIPVEIPWNLQRTELEKEKDVVFGKIRWSGSGPGPHDIFADRLGNNPGGIGTRREKIGTVTWSIETICYKTVQTNAGHYRWLITPCPVLLRTYTPLNGAPQTTEVFKNPQPCPGRWMNMPADVGETLSHSLRQPDLALKATLPSESLLLTAKAAALIPAKANKTPRKSAR